MADLKKPTFQQGAPLDIGELNKLYDNTVTAYQQGAILRNATATGQSQSFVSIGWSGLTEINLDTSGLGSSKISFGGVFNFGVKPIVVATVVGTLASKNNFSVGVTVDSENLATISVYGGTGAKNYNVKVNYIAMANKPVELA